MTGLSPLDITAPHLEYGLLLPLIVVLGGAFIGIILEGAVPRQHRRDAQALFTGLTLVGALAADIIVWSRGHRQVAALGSVVVDGPTVATWAGLLLFGGMGVVLAAERRVNNNQSAFAPMASAVPGSPLEAEAITLRREHTEVFPVMLLTLFGMMLFAAAGDLLTMFVALEIFSLPLYILTGMSRRRRLLSQEAALKYFLLGALSSGMFLYGSALLYSYSGTLQLAGIDQAVSLHAEGRWLMLAGLGLVTVGLLFKVGAVPFHSWTPDVYQGAPTPITAFMAICTKLAAVVALARVLYSGLGGERWDWQPLLAVVAAASMVLGAILGMVQTDVKRMIAYSSITHAGFVLVPLVGASTAVNGLPVGAIGSVGAALFYMLSYGLGIMAAFGLLMMVQKSGGEATSMTSWRGIGRQHPWLAGLMSLAMVSFAGLPPTVGFVAKLVGFAAAWRGGYGWLVVIAVLASLMAAAFYFRFVVLMFFTSATDEGVTVVRPGVQTTAVVGVCSVLIVVLGLFGGFAMTLMEQASGLLR